MAQAGYTPISLYYSSTAAAQPSSGNLVNGELALNIQDGKLFYKDATGAVQTLATKITLGTAYQINAVNSAGTAATYQGLSSLIDNSLSASTQGMILYRGASGWTPLTPGSNGYYLTLAAGIPSWTAAISSGVTTFSAGSTGFTPSTATSGAVTLSGTLNSANGGTGFSTYATGNIIYASGVNTLAKLAAGSNGNVLTIAGGVPSWGAEPVTSFSTSLSGLTPATSSTGAITLAGTLGPTSGGTGQTTYTTGDIIYASNTNTLSKLAAGTNGYVLTLASGLPTWAVSSVGVSSFSTSLSGLTPTIATTGAVTLAGTLGLSSGGTGFSTYAAGDIIIASATNVLSKLAAGANGYVLTMSAGIPTWAAGGGGGGGVTSFQTSLSGLTPSTSTTGAITLAGTLGETSGGTGFSTYATGDLIYASNVNTLSKLTAGTNGYVLTLAAGVPTWAASTGGVTSFTTSLSGLTPNTSTTGAITLAGTLGPTSGGTGLGTYTIGDIIYASASNTLAKLPAGTNGQYLVLAAGIPSWTTAVSSGVSSFSAGTTGFTPSTASTGAVVLAGTLISGNGGTGVSTYTAGDTLYYAAGSALSKLTIGASTTIMTSTGTAPQWSAASGVSVGTATNMAGGLAGTTYYQTSVGVTTTLAIGSAYQVKAVNAAATAPSWQGLSSLIDNALTASAQGSILYRNASSWVALAPGTSGNVLTTAGAAANPSWSAITVSGVIAPTQGGTGIANNASSTLTISGAFGTTLTVSGTTSVTLPTSGTLLSTAVAVTPAQGGTGISNNAASTITISGASPITLTVSGTTAITLPTTGTVATLAGSETFTNKTLTNPTITNFTESLVAIGNSGTTQTIALTSGTVQTVTMTGNCTFTMPSVSAGKSFILIVSTGSGSFTGAFTGVKWPSATPPVITVTATRFDVISFVSDGTNWYGNYAQAYA